MRIVVAGGTGFLGAPLVAALRAEEHDVIVLSRGAKPGRRVVNWAPDGTAGAWRIALEGADAVVNLAGTTIERFPRWTRAHKRRVLESRVLATRSLVGAIESSERRPRLLISASGVGYYGDRGSEVLTEDSAPGGGFLAEVCQAWETEAARAERAGARVVVLRTGVVFARDGGALPRMMLPFRFFVGGRWGSGRQYLSWIHRTDYIRLMTWLMTAEGSRGAFNASTPAPVANEEFARALGRAMRRPALFPTPGLVLKLAIGEMAGPLLLESQRAVPARAVQGGFAFRYPTLGEAFDDLFRR